MAVLRPVARQSARDGCRDPCTPRRCLWGFCSSRPPPQEFWKLLLYKWGKARSPVQCEQMGPFAAEYSHFKLVAFLFASFGSEPLCFSTMLYLSSLAQPWQVSPCSQVSLALYQLSAISASGLAWLRTHFNQVAKIIIF